MKRDKLKKNSNENFVIGVRKKKCFDLDALNPCGCFCPKKSFDLKDWKPKDEVPFHPCDDMGSGLSMLTNPLV